MSKTLRFVICFAGASVALLAGSGCSARSRAARVLRRADRYFASGQYPAAEIEYLNLLHLDRRNPQAIARLGMIYYDQGRAAKALSFLLEARRLAPDNLDMRLKLGLCFLAFGKFPEARQEADYILDHGPGQEDAPLLLAEAALRPGEIGEARKRLQRLPAPAATGAPVLAALATLDFREGHLPEAEALLRRALVLDPKSSAAAVALAALDWQKKDLGEAGHWFARAAELAPEHSARRLQYAQFKLQTGDRAGARRLLEDNVRRAPDFLPARILLAELDEVEGKYPLAVAEVAAVLAQDPVFPDAMILSGRLSRIQGQPKKAAAELEIALKRYPRYPMLEYELARAYLDAGEVEKARAGFDRAVREAPDYTDAALALARLSLQLGDGNAAIAGLKHVVAIRPDLTPAAYLLGDAYVQRNDLDDALAVYRRLAQVLPGQFQPRLLAGMVLLRQERLPEARESFARAQQLAPDDPTVEEQLDNLDLAQKRYAPARQRVESLVQRQPALALPYVLLAKILLAQGETERAEAALARAVKRQPDSPGAHLLLAQLHLNAHQDKEALADLKIVAGHDPKDIKILMLMGAIAEQEKDYPAARDAYVRVVAAEPNFGPALNNLADLDSEIFGDLDKALALAQRARRALGDDPNAADTLGWILYQKHQYQPALALLQESTTLRADPEALFHLGMTQSMLGDEGLARITLQRAVQSPRDFPGVDQARQRLSILSIDPAAATAAERTELEQITAAHPDDAIALGRLAAICEQAGEVKKAAGLYLAVMKENPENAAALTGLARVSASQGDWARAFELAKAAHRLAPEAPEATHLLGRTAYQRREYSWAASLLQEAAAQEPGDAGVLFDLARASYGVGQVSEAEAEMRAAQQGKMPPVRAAEAGQFIELIELSNHPGPAAAASSRVEHILAGEPDNLPALMAEGVVCEEKGDPLAAKRVFEQMLARDPDFSPAQKSLARLYSEHPGDEGKALAFANQARNAFPADPEVAKAYGIILYRHGDFERAADLLEESSRQRVRDGELTFYLGMVRYRLKLSSSRQTLERALGLNLNADRAGEARRTLALLKDPARPGANRN